MAKTFNQWWKEVGINHPAVEPRGNENMIEANVTLGLLRQLAFDAWSAAIGATGYLPFDSITILPYKKRVFRLRRGSGKQN